MDRGYRGVATPSFLDTLDSILLTFLEFGYMRVAERKSDSLFEPLHSCAASLLVGSPHLTQMRHFVTMCLYNTLRKGWPPSGQSPFPSPPAPCRKTLLIEERLARPTGRKFSIDAKCTEEMSELASS